VPRLRLTVVVVFAVTALADLTVVT